MHLCVENTHFHIFFSILCQIVTNFAFLGPFFSEFYYCTFLIMNIIVKPSFKKSMWHKCVLGCTYLLQRLVSIDFSQFCDKQLHVFIFLSFQGLILPVFFFQTIILIQIMVKTSFERSMGHKYVWGALMGCTYVMQICVFIDFLQFCNKQ